MYLSSHKSQVTKHFSIPTTVIRQYNRYSRYIVSIGLKFLNIYILRIVQCIDRILQIKSNVFLKKYMHKYLVLVFF